MLPGFIALLVMGLIFTGCKPESVVWATHSADDYQSDLAGEELHGSMSLLLTSFSDFDEFKKIVEIRYMDRSRGVILEHRSSGYKVESVLRPGVSEGDLKLARDGTTLDKLSILFKSPYAVYVRYDLQSVEWLARHRPGIFGEGDIAFYDLAEQMVANISARNRAGMTERDLDEKGYLNTFNHVIAQAFMTTLYSERFADFVADLHERQNMPELVSGDFTPEQIDDLDFGALDNYLDMINNEWGQEVGKYLTQNLEIDCRQCWDYDLVCDYLNGVQSFMSRSFGIFLSPFKPSDMIVVKFTGKLNKATGNCSFGVDELYSAGCITCTD